MLTRLKLLPMVLLLGTLPASHQAALPASALPASLPDSPLLDSLLRADARLLPVVSQASAYELQVIYIQIDRDNQNQPHFTQHSFHVNPRQYFNPASLVKLPTAALALEKLHQLNIPGLTRNAAMSTGTAFRCQTAAPFVSSPDSDRINSVGNYIKRMLLVSDNQAYNRLYEFVGQRPLNERLWQLGYPEARIVRRFAPCDTAANRHTNPISFKNAAGQIIYQQPPATNHQSLGFPLGRITKGRAYQTGGHIVTKPYDFTTANYLPLETVTTMLKAILFPEAVSAANRFQLTAADYGFLRQYLRYTPHASGYTPYRSAQYFDAYKKYLYYGRQRTATNEPGIHIYNVVGLSHGYVADVAYITDKTQAVEFMLSAVLYVNKDGVLNDGVYEYDSIGYPFLAALGQHIYRFELKRPHNVPEKESQQELPEDKSRKMR